MKTESQTPKQKHEMEKKKFAIYESGIVETLISSMYGNLEYFLEITTLTQFFKKSVELLAVIEIATCCSP